MAQVLEMEVKVQKGDYLIVLANTGRYHLIRKSSLLVPSYPTEKLAVEALNRMT